MFYFPPILNIFFLFKEDIPLNIPVGKSLREKVNNEMGRFKKHDYVLSFWCFCDVFLPASTASSV